MTLFYDYGRLIAQLRNSNQRILCVINGDRDWGWLQTRHLPSDLAMTIISEDSRYHGLHPSRATTLLGSETDCIIFDAHDGFDANAFAAVSGTLRGGGVLCLLLPDFDHCRNYLPGRFISRFIGMINEDRHVLVIAQHGQLTPINPLPDSQRPTTAAPYKTEDQRKVVETITDTNSDKEQIIILTADRGRGKSASLGLAAAQIMTQTGKKLIITAPRFSVCRVFYRHLQQQLPTARRKRAEVRHGDSVCNFIAPDELILNPIDADILFVDEAAAIPAFILQRILENYPTVVFATTTHGYEGSGQGFMLRFLGSLDKQQYPYRHMTLQTPIRWSEDDPLERFINNALLLDTQLSNPDADFSINHCRISTLDRNSLGQNEQQLREIVGLLKQAHYRTRPSDVLQMLDAKDHDIICCQYNDQIVALAWVCHEDRLDDDLGELIYQGKRRPDGHLLAQSLTYHAGFDTAYRYAYSRVIRIAVHPQLRRKGIASRLLDAVISSSRGAIVGSSFAASADVCRFWQANGYYPARLGLKRNASSGAYSMIVIKAKTTNAQAFVDGVQQRFRQTITDALERLTSDIDEALKSLLLANNLGDDGVFNDQDMLDFLSFINGHRGLELTIHAIRQWLQVHQHHYDFSDHLDERQIRSLNTVMRKPLPLPSQADVPIGKKQREQRVLAALSILYEQYE